MHYWWVNQNQTYAHEVGGGYMWSPKRKKDGAKNYFYDAMRIVCPGDFIYSFASTYIRAFGIATSYCYEFPKPWEFGSAGDNWGTAGWRVDVNFHELDGPQLKPKELIEQIRPLLSNKYAPLDKDGNGYQHVYLTEISEELAFFLAGNIDSVVLAIAKNNRADDREFLMIDRAAEEQMKWERRIEAALQEDKTVPDTEKEALIRARVGQGEFRNKLAKIENCCRVTKVDRIEHLIASHTKPWRDSSNEERLDPENGLLLTPTIDHLFDRGFISFENSGDLILSTVADIVSLKRMGIDSNKILNVGKFSSGQKKYLEWHRENLLLR